MDTPFDTYDNDRYHSNLDSSLANDDDGYGPNILARLNSLVPLPPLLSTSMDGTSASMRGRSSDNEFYVQGEHYHRRTSEIKDEIQEFIASIESSVRSSSHDQPTSQPALIHSQQHAVDGDNVDGHFHRQTSLLKDEYQEYKNIQLQTSRLMDEYQDFIASIEGSDISSSGSHDQPTSQPPSIHARQHAVDRGDDDRDCNTASKSSHGHPHSQGVDPTGGNIQGGSTLGTTSPVHNVGTNSTVSRRSMGRRLTDAMQYGLPGTTHPTRSGTSPTSDTNHLPVLWEDEMNFFEKTSGMNNGENNIHECGNVSDSKEERHRRYSNARGGLCSRNAMVTCAVVGSLIAITFGATMKKRNELPNVAMSKHEGDVHKPNWFDRSAKWKGQTYAEAVDFCTSNNQMLCPYETICPFGPGSEAVGVGSGGFGSEEDNPYGLAWAPINNAPNAWVHVGSKDHCLKYDFIHNGPPAWGVTGEENEEITRHLACCPPTSTSKIAEKNAPNDPDDTPPMIPMYQPLDNVWYTRSDGWQGSTFDEALKFCGTKGKKHFPCPYEAYCPKGPHFPPVEGGPTTQSWSPILDETGNGFVQVAGGGNDKICKVHHLPLKNDSLRGKGALEDTMTHVMCCQLVDDNN